MKSTFNVILVSMVIKLLIFWRRITPQKFRHQLILWWFLRSTQKWKTQTGKHEKSLLLYNRYPWYNRQAPGGDLNINADSVSNPLLVAVDTLSAFPFTRKIKSIWRAPTLIVCEVLLTTYWITGLESDTSTLDPNLVSKFSKILGHVELV